MSRELSRATRANRDWWTAASASYQRANRADLEDDVRWGPSMPSEGALRVLGEVAGKDVLEIGCGGGQCAIHLARAGARVTALDLSPAQLDHARGLAARKGANVRFLEGSAEDLSALPDGAFDLAFSAFALGWVEDLDRALAEAARVLRPGGLLAFSWSSPLFDRTALTPEGMLIVAKSYFDRQAWPITDEYGTTVEFYRTYGDWHAALTRAGFIVTDLLEPEPIPVESTWKESHPLAKIQMVPGTVIWRARKPVRAPF